MYPGIHSSKNREAAKSTRNPNPEVMRNPLRPIGGDTARKPKNANTNELSTNSNTESQIHVISHHRCEAVNRCGTVSQIKETLKTRFQFHFRFLFVLTSLKMHSHVTYRSGLHPSFSTPCVLSRSLTSIPQFRGLKSIEGFRLVSVSSQRGLRNSRKLRQSLNVNSRSRQTLCTTAGLNLVFISAEVTPWSKTGGLGDVVGGLPIELSKLGHKVMTIAPR